jgi:hypothetical protein
MFGTTMQAMQGTPLARYIPRDQRQQHGNSATSTSATPASACA